MRLTINGEKREIEESLNLQDLLHLFLKQEEYIIVELNGNLIGKNEYKHHKLKNGDSIEVIQMVGGG